MGQRKRARQEREHRAAGGTVMLLWMIDNVDVAHR
jgi:hypothetical protein